MLKEHAAYYYLEDNCNCAEAILLAANDEYGLGLPDDVCKLMGGFGGGVSCGSTCGALLGAVAALGVRKMGRRAHETDDFNKECGELAQAFRETLGDVNCSELKPIYVDQKLRCLKIVLAACDMLESHLAAAAKE